MGRSKGSAAAAAGVRRILVVHNPRSSRAAEVETEVLMPLFKFAMDRREEFTVGMYEVLPTNVDDNAEKLANVLQCNDIVITAGGDGTATIGLNGAILAQKRGVSGVVFTALPYGNFNDTARLFGFRSVFEVMEALADGGSGTASEEGSATLATQSLYPLEALVDGRHFRYAACYVTVGMLAESTEAFDAVSVRTGLQQGQKSWLYSISTLFAWWRKNRKREFLPRSLAATDVLAVNGRSVAKAMRVRKPTAFLERGFLVCKRDLSKFVGAAQFVAHSTAFGMRGKLAERSCLKFEEVFEVEIQAEGEYVRKKCREIEVVKCVEAVEVLVKR